MNFHAVHLHTGDPGNEGDEIANEATFDGYAPVIVPSAVWTDGNPAANTAAIVFPTCTSDRENRITHASITLAGSPVILYSGAIALPVTVSRYVAARFAPFALEATPKEPPIEKEEEPPTPPVTPASAIAHTTYSAGTFRLGRYRAIFRDGLWEVQAQTWWIFWRTFDFRLRRHDAVADVRARNAGLISRTEDESECSTSHPCVFCLRNRLNTVRKGRP